MTARFHNEQTKSMGDDMNSTRCPQCHNELDEGPIMYRCATCRRAVFAADLENEFVPGEPVAA